MMYFTVKYGLSMNTNFDKNTHLYMYTKILEVNLFAFAYRLFRRDFSPLDGTYCIYICMLQFICILELQVVECSMGSFYTQRF